MVQGVEGQHDLVPEVHWYVRPWHPRGCLAENLFVVDFNEVERSLFWLVTSQNLLDFQVVLLEVLNGIQGSELKLDFFSSGYLGGVVQVRGSLVFLPDPRKPVRKDVINPTDVFNVPGEAANLRYLSVGLGVIKW